jgi:hypothetical protein
MLGDLEIDIFFSKIQPSLGIQNKWQRTTINHQVSMMDRTLWIRNHRNRTALKVEREQMLICNGARCNLGCPAKH